MTYRKIQSFESGIYKSVVQYSSEWQEYRIRLYVKGALYDPADCFESDKESALSTAQHMVNFNKELFGDNPGV